jgi:hypothetical protein
LEREIAMIMMSRILRATALIAPLLLPTGALAKELCHLAGKDILGDQITMTLKWPIDPDRPPELLERPAEPSMDDLFSDAQGSGSEKAPCDGSNIVDALKCRVIGPMTDVADAPVDPGKTETETSNKTAPAAPENAEGEKTETETAAKDRDYDRYVYATIRMRPLIRSGQPPQVLMAHEDTGLDFDTQKIDKSVVDRVNADLVETSRQIRSWSTTLDMETAADLAAGKPWPSLELAAMPDFKRSAGANLSMPDEMRFPEACGSLILIETQLADALTALRPAQERLQRLQARKRDLQRADPDMIEAEIEALETRREKLRNAGLPITEIDNQIKAAQNRLEEVENRDDIIEKLDTQIKIAGNKVRQLAEPVQVLEQRDIARRKALNEEARLARLDAIRSDPEALENEKLARLGEAMTAYRNFRTYEKKRAAAIESYNKGLADFDQKIADAPDDETRSKLEDSKERFQRLYDQWTDHSRTVASRSFRDLDRMLEDNTRDGIGPTTIPGIVEEVNNEGVDAADYFEGYDPNEIDRARRIALSDAVTLGGEASNDSGTLQFLKDTSQALQEEREKIILTPSDVVDKLGQVARGETTLEEVVNDQKQFLERYGHYAKGTVIGGANGVKDLAVLAHDGLTYALETDEALLKGAYKAVTGEEIKGSYFGDRKHKALEKLTGSAADAVTELLDRNNARHGVRTDGQRVDIADVWDDPAKVGDFLGQTYGDYKRLGELSDQAIVSGSEMARDAADRKLASITKGGEKSLRGALGKTGEFVGEISDVGLAGLWALDKFGDAAKGLRRLEDGLDTAEDVALATDRARDVARTPVGDETVRLPEPDLPGTTSQPNSARAPPVEETARLADPDLPPASTADSTSARPVGDETARLPEPDLPSTASRPGSQRAPQVEETGRLADPDLPSLSTADTPSTQALDETLRLPDTNSQAGRETATFRDAKDGPETFASTETLPPADRGELSATLRDGPLDPVSRTERMPAPENSQRPDFDPEGTATLREAPGGGNPAAAAQRRQAIEYDLKNAADRAELIRIRPKDGRPSGPALDTVKSSPFAQSMTPSPETFRPKPYQVTQVHDVAPYVPPGGRPPNPKDYFGGHDVKIDGITSGDDTFRLGERLGGGANTTAYRSRNAAGDLEDAVIRVTPIDDDGADIALELASKKLLEQARAKGTQYFSPSEKIAGAPPPQVIEVDGKRFLMSKEPMVIDAERMFPNRINNRAPEGAPEANALQELTAALAVQEMNAHGLAWTDHKPANFAIVEDAASPTGYRAVIFDPGGIAPMKGATAADRAANARFVQRQFDPSIPRQVLSDIDNPRLRQLEIYDRIETMRNDAMIEELVDITPFEKTLKEAGGDATWLTPTTPVSNLGRDKYFELSAMSPAELQTYVRNNDEIARLLAERNKSVDDVVIPTHVD